jgi:hypothetical protein
MREMRAFGAASEHLRRSRIFAARTRGESPRFARGWEAVGGEGPATAGSENAQAALSDATLGLALSVVEPASAHCRNQNFQTGGR